MTYLAVEGVIGVGKTTLARLLQPEFDAQLLLEVFEENPFLSDFYRDRSRYAFQTQIFFLLSRYRQQQALVQSLEEGSVLCDYIFGKDYLFAHENLTGDELQTYERLYAALSANVPVPDLVVYLYAETDVLMDRIAIRDRSYERTMSRGYIEQLRRAYERFFSDYDESPVVRIDCSDLDFVRKPEDLDLVRHRIRSVLAEGTHQRVLPPFVERSRRGRRVSDGGESTLHGEQGTETSTHEAAYLELSRFQGEVGMLASALLQLCQMEHDLATVSPDHRPSLDQAIEASRVVVRGRLEACATALSDFAKALGLRPTRIFEQALRAGAKDANDQEKLS
ncbi:MAG: deoxynucleoside kinase [Anaerolineae bacterium]